MLLGVLKNVTLHKQPDPVKWAHLFTAEKSKTETFPGVDVVMISCHRVDQTRNAIRSLQASEHLPFSVYLVENGSPTAIRRRILNEVTPLPGVKTIFNRTNLYCGGGRRQGAEYCRSEFVAFYDNDMLFRKKCISSILSFYEKYSAFAEIGAVGSVVLWNEKVQLQGRMFKDGKIDYSRDSKMQIMPDMEFFDIIHGGATVYRNSCLKQVNHDSAYRCACDDFDTLMQIKAQGCKIGICYDSFVVHRPTVSGPADEYLRLRRNWKMIREDQKHFAEKWGIQP